jgi:hypothetical protein
LLPSRDHKRCFCAVGQYLSGHAQGRGGVTACVAAPTQATVTPAPSVPDG